MADNPRIENLRKAHAEAFGAEPIVALAPGRVNLIGEHVDYNGGLVLPMAMELAVLVSASPGKGDRIRLRSLNFDAAHEADLSDLVRSEKAPWADYVLGVVNELVKSAIGISGFDAVIEGNVPVGSGLSSSAALEVATAMALQGVFGFEMQGRDMANLCQRAENFFVGVNCGIMDQFVSRMAKAGHLLLLDCRSLDFEHVAIDTEGFRIVVADTMVRRELADSAYNERRAQCEKAAAAFERINRRVRRLRDVTVETFEEYRSVLRSELMARRAEHVVYEIRRVIEAGAAIEAGDYSRFGELMVKSHESLRDLYEVSCPQLDLLVDLFLERDGVLGARMTGAGFGGCMVALVRADRAEAALESALPAYREKTGLEPAAWVSTPQAGARLVE